MRVLGIAVCLTLVACSGARLAPPNEPERADASSAGRVPIGEFMAHLYSYPTGHFDPRWPIAARQQDLAVKSAMPAGAHAHLKATSALDPARFTALGPKPLNTNGDLNSGRINDIVVSPQPRTPGDPNSYRAFAASDGGGVWRSNNCCSAATTWEPVTDDPELTSIAIGDLELDPNNPDVIYAGTGDLRFGSWAFGAVGVLKSSDGGDHWQLLGREVFVPNYPTPVGAFPQYQAVGKLAVDPNDSQRIVAGTKTGLYVSYDAGSNWTGPCLTNGFGPTSSNPHRQDITGLLAINRGGSTRLVAAVGTRGLATPIQPDLDQNGANGIYAASMPSSGCPTNWQLLSRADNGWPANIATGLPFSAIGRIEIAVAPSNPDVLYAEGIDSGNFVISGVWRSIDGGATWEKRSGVAGFQGCEPGTQNWYNAGLTVDPGNPDALILSAWWTYRSTNGGQTFANLLCQSNNQSAVHIDQHARAFVGGDSARLLIGNDGGIYYSANATSATPSFVSLNASMNAIEFYYGDLSANFADAPERVIVGGAQDNGTSVLVQSGPASAATWTWVNGGDGISTRIDPVLGQRVYYSSQYGAINLSTNGPNQPEQSASGPWAPGLTSGDRKSFLMPFDLYKYGDINVAGSGCSAFDGCTRLIAGTYRVWESTNGAQGATQAARWTAISPDLTKGTLVVNSDNRSVIQAIRYAVSDPRVAIVGTLDGNVSYGFGLGSGGAATWRDVSDGNRVLPNRPILGVATDPNNPLIGYAAIAGFGANTPATPGHVYQIRCSADCASFSWRDASGNLPDVPVNAVIVNPWLPRQVYIGTDWGLYFTDNIDATTPIWQRFDGLPRAMVWDLAIDRGYTTLAVYTRSRGAWVWPLPRSAAQPNLTGLWAASGEDGWGLSVAHQGEVLFPAWYTYDSSGRPAWYLVAGAARQSDGSYLGDLYRFTGTAFAQINGSVANQPGSVIGTARFTPLDSGQMRFQYEVGGSAQSRTLSRFAIGPLPTCRFVSGSRASASNHSDIWWNPSESGWGLHLIESSGRMFAAWYTYAADGQPMWVTSLLSRQADGRFVGTLNRPISGTPFALINGPATSFPVPEVGSASLRFSDGEHASFAYTLDGVSQVKAIQRFVYAGPQQSVCE